MNTYQSRVVGKGNYATLPTQNGSFLEQKANSSHTINPRAFLAQTRLINLADAYQQFGFDQGPIQAVNNLLMHWLSCEAIDLPLSQLHQATLMADFLEELLSVYLPKAEEGRTDA